MTIRRTTGDEKIYSCCGMLVDVSNGAPVESSEVKVRG